MRSPYDAVGAALLPATGGPRYKSVRGWWCFKLKGKPRFNLARKVGGRALVSLTLAIVVSMLAACFQLSQARAQDHNHPPADAAIHEKFYSTWMMPDRPDLSCCNRQDCYPTEVRFRDGFWEAKRREDGVYVRVPWEKVEKNRDNPDGRNHVCMPPPNRSHQEVFCFALGGGT
jgi:hypothetical protein